MQVPEDSNERSIDLPVIDATVFARFAAAKGISTKCTSCGQDGPGWTVYHLNGLPPSLIGTRQGQLLVSPPVIQLVPIHCNNCGYVREYDRNVIVEWLRNING